MMPRISFTLSPDQKESDLTKVIQKPMIKIIMYFPVANRAEAIL